MDITQLTLEDLRLVVSRLPSDVVAEIKAKGLILGGGFIRETIAGNAPKDIDLFSRTVEIAQDSARHITHTRLDHCDCRIHTTDNAITVVTHGRMPIQYITKWLYTNPEDVLGSFDFTVCMAVIWFSQSDNTWKSSCHSNFYSDLAARRLVYTYPVREEAAGGSMMRVRKFLSRGYSIQAPSLAGVIARVCGAIRDFDEKSEQDRAFVIKGLLCEVDPLIVIDGIEPREE